MMDLKRNIFLTDINNYFTWNLHPGTGDPIPKFFHEEIEIQGRLK